MAALVLLATTVVVLVAGHARVRPVVVMPIAVGVAVVAGVVDLTTARDAVEPLGEALAFVVVAVPVALLLDTTGCFDAAAARVGHGPHVTRRLWVLAALVTVLFNLDASIVLLTPLYVRVARRQGVDPLALALQPVLLSSLASSVLPVSNLTNLVFQAERDTTVVDFLVHLAPASVVATTVGWWAYRRSVLAGAEPVPVTESAPRDPARDRRALLVGGPAVLTLLVGFTAGDVVGVPAWLVAAVVAAGLACATRSVPWRAVPVDAVVVAAGLAILAAAAAPHLGLDRLLGGDGAMGRAQAAVVGAVGANAINNLPALLVGLPYVRDDTAWALLAGVNMGPVIWLGGSLAGLLWLELVRKEGIAIDMWSYARIAVRAGVPALAAGLAVVVLVPGAG